MDATPAKVIQFFSGFKQSVIPLFQRQYQWQKENWQTLWDDTLERYEAEKDVDHFLGAIVHDPGPVSARGCLEVPGDRRPAAAYDIDSPLVCRA